VHLIIHSTYDQRYRMQSNQLLRVANGQLIAGKSYGYDPAGNITSLGDQIDPAYSRSFGYDGLNRLVTASSGAALWGNGAFTYDAMGNMQTMTIGSRVTQFSYQGATQGGTTSSYRTRSGLELGIPARSPGESARAMIHIVQFAFVPFTLAIMFLLLPAWLVGRTRHEQPVFVLLGAYIPFFVWLVAHGFEALFVVPDNPTRGTLANLVLEPLILAGAVVCTFIPQLLLPSPWNPVGRVRYWTSVLVLAIFSIVIVLLFPNLPE
jgi:hypothetical protein